MQQRFDYASSFFTKNTRFLEKIWSIYDRFLAYKSCAQLHVKLNDICLNYNQFSRTFKLQIVPYLYPLPIHILAKYPNKKRLVVRSTEIDQVSERKSLVVRLHLLNVEANLFQINQIQQRAYKTYASTFLY